MQQQRKLVINEHCLGLDHPVTVHSYGNMASFYHGLTQTELALQRMSRTLLLVDLYLLPQAAFPSGGLYFKNETWAQETRGKHVIIHNNYITGFEKKIKRFCEFKLWLVDDHSDESPLGRI